MEMNRIDQCAKIRFSDGNTSIASVIFSKVCNFLTVNLSRQGVKRSQYKSLIYHEIGTHLIRGANELAQPWRYKRKKYKLEPHYGITEEGLAILNSLLVLKNKLLWKYAVSYYTVVKA